MGFKQTVPQCLQYKSFENTVRKGAIARNEQFVLFHSVFYALGELSAIFIKFKIVACKAFEFESLKFAVLIWVLSKQFLSVCSTSLLKTRCEKERLLVTSNLSFSTVFSTRWENFPLFSSNLKLSPAKPLSLKESKFCRFDMGFK